MGAFAIGRSSAAGIVERGRAIESNRLGGSLWNPEFRLALS